MVNTRKSNKQQGKKTLRCNTKRRKKLNDRRTIRGAPMPRPIKKSLLAQELVTEPVNEDPKEWANQTL